MKYKMGKKVHHSEWVPGKVYFLEGGTSPFLLVSKPPTASWNHRDESNYKAEYISGVKADGTKTYLIEAIEQEETQMATKLYEIKDDIGNLSYGHKLARDSSGKWVMEIKGRGDIVAVEPSKIKEVLPYTIDVSFSNTGQNYSYISEAGFASVGDLFVIDAPSGREIVRVEGVNTEKKSATKEFKPLGKLLLDTE